MSVLTGIRVVDATYGLAGPMLGQLLADMSADIVRIDRSDGEVRSRQGALVRLRGRRSIVLEPESAEARDVLRRLMEGADVVVTEPDIHGEYPLPWQYEELSAMNPELILCRITGYGDEGPLVGGWHHDHLVAARYGVYDQPGWRDGPTFLTAPVPSIGAALLALQAIGSALYVREKTGEGQELTTSLLAGALGFQPGMINASVQRAIADTGLVPRSPLGAAPFYSIYECGDGNWLHFGCLTQEFQRKAMEAIGLEKELTELGFGQARQATPETRDRVIELITARMKEKPYSEWASIFEAADVPHAPSQWSEDLLDDPQVRHERLVISVNDPVVGPSDQMGPTIVFEDAPFREPRPMPLPGKHTDEICREIGLADEEIARLKDAGAVR
jgi:crotonobetainyl-CoA:carnitine CoA-transferase CaiB-like acyl-CoA transferase